jgi:SAM-dependent methyltransferase
VSAAESDSVWPLHLCSECGLVRLGRLPAVGEAYPAEYYGKADKKFLPIFEGLSHRPPVLLETAERLAHESATRERRGPDVLDVGCGRGYFLKRLRKAGWSCAGIDIPSSPIPQSEDGMDCRSGDASSLPWPARSFDLVVINHVLEHVADPWLACREAARVLRDGGILYVGVPNFGSWQSQVFGGAWFPLEIPRHLFHFTPDTLSMVVSASGFCPQKTSTWSLTQGTFGFIQSALNQADHTRRNSFLALVKGQRATTLSAALLHALAACVLLPAGVIETICSSALSRGPIVAMVARKSSVH